MKLRARLGLTVLLGLLPIGVALLWLHGRLHRTSFEEGVAQAVVSRMRTGGRERCEENPAGFGRMGPPHRRGRRRRPRRHPGPRPEGLAAYTADLRPSSSSAPPLPPAVAQPLRDGEPFATQRLGGPGGSTLYAVRMPWQSGPCAVIAVRRPTPPQAPRPLLPLVLLSALAAALAFLAAAPVVGRIRRLTRAIRETPGDDPAQLDLRGADEVAELARAFDAKQRKLAEQMQALRRRDRALSEHLANTMHDVMIPLTVLQGHLMQLRGGVAEESSGEALSAAIGEAHYIGTLLTNLDAWARLDADDTALSMTRVDLGELLQRVVVRHLPVARERGVELAYTTPDTPLLFDADETLLERAVGNVVHNAVRHNQRGGHVAVILERLRDGFELRVLDDGPGMSPAQAQRMVARGVSGDAARSRRGHGLGLSITARAADLHGLTLEFRHPPEGGLEVALVRRANTPPAR